MLLLELLAEYEWWRVSRVQGGNLKGLCLTDLCGAVLGVPLNSRRWKQAFLSGDSSVSWIPRPGRCCGVPRSLCLHWGHLWLLEHPR